MAADNDLKRRHYRFTGTVEQEIGERQNYRCAVCAKHLGHRNCKTLSEYHHVIPCQAGTPSNAQDNYIKTADNGVLICKEPCHADVAHGYSRYAGFTAYADAFEHSHFQGFQAHRNWARKLDAQVPTMWQQYSQ